MYAPVDRAANRAGRTTGAKDFLIEKGFDPQYGARPLRRTIQRMVEDPLAEGLLQGKYHPGDLIEAVVVDDDLVLQVRHRIEQLPPPALRPKRPYRPAEKVAPEAAKHNNKEGREHSRPSLFFISCILLIGSVFLLTLL